MQNLKDIPCLILGIGNILWADEGFGVRVVEAFNDKYAFTDPNNVIADGGLVGLVEEVSSNYATVRSIIDDSSSVSAMTASTSDTCIVSGDLRLISDGKLAFSQLNTTDTVAEGEKIVTSNISDKYLRGILIGYVSEITEDSNHLTKKGYIIPVVDFQHIQEVLVIKELKQQGGE